MESQVDAYLDGELAAMDAAELEAHLAGCASCGRFRDDRLALRAAIAAQMPRFEAPEALRAARARSAAQSVRHRVAPPPRRAHGMARAGARRLARRSSRSAAGGSRRSTPPRRS